MQESQLNALLIEFDLAEADSIREMLSESAKQKFSVQHVQSVADGIGLLRSRDFDAVLIDLDFPDSRGLETALTVRNQASRVPIIILTSFDDEDMALQAFKSDIQSYLLKSEITGSQLRRSIRYAMQRKCDTEALRENKQRFESFMLHLPAAAWMKDLDGRYVYANAETERIFSAPLSELFGKSNEEILPLETARRIRENNAQVLAEGVSLRTTEVLHEADGIDHHYIVSKFAVPGPEGQMAYIAGVAFDITAAIQLQAEIQRVASFPLMNPNPILEVDTDGKMNYCNPAAEQILKRPEYANSANPFIPEDFPVVLRELQKNMSPCIYRELEIDGVFYEETICLAIQGNAVRIYVMDVTRRKKAEQERERLLVELDAVMNSINEGVVISDLQGNILTMNPAALTLFGYETVDQVCRQVHLFRDTFELFYLDGRTMPYEQWPTFRLLNGEQFTDYEVRVHRKDTGKLLVGSHNGTLVQPKTGDRILAVITVRDISERKREEEALKISEERLRYSSLAADMGMWQWDLIANALIGDDKCQELFEYPHDYPISYEAFLESIHGKDRKRIDETVRKSLQEKTEYLAEMRVPLPDGQLRWVMSKGRGFYNESGVPVRMHGIVMDMTKRKQYEEEIERLNTELAARAAELETANRELETFNYTVAHDLRKPLTVINGYCQAIRELYGDKLDKQCNGFIQEAYDATLRMHQLINALLNFSRLGHVKPRQERVDLSAITQEVALELRQSEPKRLVTFRIADKVMVKGDWDLLRVVLDNLLGNAWKYTGMREKAVIEFGIKQINGKPAYFVRDNGYGFDMAYADKLFTPFERLPGAKEHKGFGIGLATAERVILRHGGRIWADGEPGKGATFYFTLG